MFSSIMNIYTSADEAGKIIRARWADENLRKKVEEQLKNDFPDILRDGNCGMIWRQIGTPDREFERFLHLCKIATLEPVCFEYVNDKFVARNFTKFQLVSLAFEEGVNKHNETIIRRKKIIDFAGSEMKKMSELVTLWGENLVEFHHQFLLAMFPEIRGRVVDLSDWIARIGGSPDKYYYSILSLALCHTVIFDDFDLLEDENAFINEIVLPAFNALERDYGLKPVIVKISRVGEHAADQYWWCHSKQSKIIMEEHVTNFIC